MSYKVDYYTLQIMPSGSIGNIKQGSGYFYTDTPIEDIPTVLNAHLEGGDKVGVIVRIDDVGGFVI